MDNLSRYCCATLTLLACSTLSSLALAANKDITAMSWLAGVWQSQPNEAGAQYEYVYMPMFNDEMLSTQMVVTKGKTTRHEVRTIREQDGKVVIVDQPFKGDMTSAPPIPTRQLESVDSTHANFTDMKLTLTGKNAMTLELTVHPPNGAAARTVTIDLKRTMRFSDVK